MSHERAANNCGVWFVAPAMAALLAAGVSKLTDLQAFAEAIRHWRIVPNSIAPFLALSLPVLEVVVSGAWFCGLMRRTLALCAIVLLTSFTAAFAIETISNAPPKCACLGAWSSGTWMDRPVAVSLRNGVLLALLAAGALATRKESENAVVENIDVSSRARAFSIVELLVVIAIVSVIVALVVPSIAAVRARAVDARQLSHLRGHAAAIAMYQSDYTGAFPFLADPNQETTTIRCEALDFDIAIKPFDAWQWWHVGLADSYYNGAAASPAFGGRERPGTSNIRTSVLYPICFLARPEYWNFETRTSLKQQIGATRDADVMFASKKIGLVEWVTGTSQRQGDPTSHAVSFVDGSAAVLRVGMLTQRAPAEHAYPTYSSYPFLMVSFPDFYTLDGVRGQDIK